MDKDKKLLAGFTADMSTFSDQALTLAAIAPFADDSIKISGISHIRSQECDRIAAIHTNLTHMGVKCDIVQDEAIIYPSTPHSCEIETYDDHRVAMAFALTGLMTEGIIIKDPLCCRKTFAEYFEVFEDAIRQLQD